VPNEMDAAPEGFTLVNQGRTFTPFATEAVLYKPFSGVNWPPSAYDPQSHLMYICANDRIGAARREAENSPPTHDKSWLGGTLVPPNMPTRGLLVAMDLTTHRVNWAQQWNYSCSAGNLVTAGGLLIHGRNDGRVVALDKASGAKLWEYQTDAGVNGSASTFMHEGVQYVAILSAGSIYANGPHGDSLWLFSLQGDLPSPPIGLATPAPGAAAPATAAPVAAGTVEPVVGYVANLDSGKTLYQTVCVTCHGESGEGGHQGGAPLKGKDLSLSHIMTTASVGKNAMPAFQAAFSREQLQDVATYIRDQLLMP
jgi:quinohemoprotein ethanol dehydrogenase